MWVRGGAIATDQIIRQKGGGLLAEQASGRVCDGAPIFHQAEPLRRPPERRDRARASAMLGTNSDARAPGFPRAAESSTLLSASRWRRALRAA